MGTASPNTSFLERDKEQDTFPVYRVMVGVGVQGKILPTIMECAQLGYPASLIPQRLAILVFMWK